MSDTHSLSDTTVGPLVRPYEHFRGPPKEDRVSEWIRF